MATVIEVTGAAGRLRAKIAPLIDEVSARSHMIAAHPDPRSTYRALLELLYTEVRTTVPLLVAVDNRAVDLAAHSDEVAKAMSPWLRQHIVEETDHDTWLIRDYIRIGGDPDALVARAGSPGIAALVGSVYYWSLHAHPAAILGYCAVLEGSPPTGAFIDRMIRATGFPPDAFDTLRHHSCVDVHHGAEIFDVIDRLPLLEAHEAIVGMTALQTADLQIAAAEELLDGLDLS
jgi:hypothetical protein